MKQWCVAKLNKEKANTLASALGISPFTAILLTIRGMDTPEKVQSFLSYDGKIDSPFEMKDMDKAAKRIIKAIESFEKICVYGDYDADGVTSTALLYSYLEAIGANVMYYIPSRDSEGYGMNIGAVEKLAEQNVNLIITVDNGISAVDEVNRAYDLGVDVVITDHHTPPQILPNAVAVVNPHQKDCSSRFKMLCGVGVAFKLVMAIEGEYCEIESLLENYADLVCIGTIGDLVPLTDENRVFIKYGIQSINQSDRIGVNALKKVYSLSEKQVTTGNISFGIVPRINAGGRLGLSQKCVDLLITDDDEKAEEIAEKLQLDNETRKQIEKDILEKINIEIENNPTLVMDKIIVISGENWHQGVIGIVASRIKEIYGKPTIIISIENNEAKGSGRSVEGFSINEAVNSCKDILKKYGGHPMAVGLSLSPDNVELFQKRINQYAQNQTMPYDKNKIDCKLNPAFLNINLAEDISCLEPFGVGNPKPVFGLYNMIINQIIPLKNNKFLKLILTRNDSKVQVLNFSIPPENFPYQEGDVVDVAVTLDVNEYKGFENLSILMKDIKFSSSENEKLIDSLRIYEDFCKGFSVPKEQLKTILPDRNDFAIVYRYIREKNCCCYSPDILCARLDFKINLGKIKVVLEAMSELGLVEICDSINKSQIKYIEIKTKVNLEDSKIIKDLKEVLANG